MTRFECIRACQETSPCLWGVTYIEVKRSQPVASDKAAQRPILVVTDDRRGLDAGSVINFLEADRNVRFEVSLGASDRARLKVDSALLSVAAHVAKREAQ